ncbi:phage portal protein [Staphylococcus xylosus]|uniref:phage portal protein n=1 Tax=Staphylococcus xylosus TaxID=1288 RepID=UPI003BF5AF82
MAKLNIFNKLKYKIIEKWVDNAVERTYNFSSWKNKTFWGIHNNTLETNETIFSAISRLSNSISSMPIKLYKNYEVIDNDVSMLITDFPNNSMTSFDLINQIETCRNEKGNAYVLIERDIYHQPKKLYMINPDVVEILMENNTNELFYRIYAATGNKLIVHNTDMMHFKHIVGSNMVRGISPIDVLKNTVDFDKAIREFNLNEMEKNESFILKYESNVDKEKRQQILDDFRSFYRDNGGILFREPGVEIDHLDKKYVSEDIVASENLTRERIANVFQIPAVFLNAKDAMTFKSTEELNRFYLQHTLLPIIKQYESEFNRKLLTVDQYKSGYYFKFNIKSFLRADSKTQADVYFKAIRSGYYTINKVREWEDLPPIENGDKPLISGDLYPIDTPVSERKSLKGGEKDDESENLLSDEEKAK